MSSMHAGVTANSWRNVTNMKFNTVLRLPQCPGSTAFRIGEFDASAVDTMSPSLRKHADAKLRTMPQSRHNRPPSIQVEIPQAYVVSPASELSAVCASALGVCSCVWKLAMVSRGESCCRSCSTASCKREQTCSSAPMGREVDKDMAECPRVHSQDLFAKSLHQYPQCQNQMRVQRSIGSATKWQGLSRLRI